MEKRNIFKMLALLACLLCSMNTVAQEAYACYTSDNTTLTFYYDDLRSTRTGTTYDLNSGDSKPEWYNDGTRTSVKQVVFDPSFADARPTSTSYWFAGMGRLQSFSGLEFMKAYNVINMSNMFNGCSSLTSLDLSSLSTPLVEDMANMFYRCSSLTNLDISNFNTQWVNDMSYMFCLCDNLTSLDVSSFNTARVTNMQGMFDSCYKLTYLDLSSFNTEQVTDMSFMFDDSPALTSLDVSNFNTANVTDMSYMFNLCSALTSLDVSSFNTANVRNMSGMFQCCYDLATIYAGSGWSTAAVTSSYGMFYNCTSLVGGMGTTYDASHTNKAYAHIDGGPSNPGYFTEGYQCEAYAEFSSDNNTLTFYYDNLRSTRMGTTYDLNTDNNKPGWYSDNNNALVTQVVFDPSFARIHPTSTAYWFAGMKQLESIIDMEDYLNTAKVTSMYHMFDKCSRLTSLDLSNFNTINVRNMSSMFLDCSGLTSINLSSFNTQFVTSMGSLFSGCTGLTSINLSSFNTQNASTMNGMFSSCNSLTSLDLSSFNTENATNMSNMFSGCSSLRSLDLSNFKTNNVTSMARMFNNCSNLTTIYVGNGWSTEAVSNSSFQGRAMFTDCTKLMGGMGTTYSTAHTDKAYAHVDGGRNNPGYFTAAADEAYAVYTASNNTLSFYYDKCRYSHLETTYNLNDDFELPNWLLDGTCTSVTRVEFDQSFANYRPICTSAWFASMTNLQSIVGMEDYLKTDSVTSMYAMFYECSSLTSLDVSSFNTQNVTDMSGFISCCTQLESIDVNHFNTENVTSMNNMFSGCESLTELDLTNFNTTKVEDMGWMFCGCNSLSTISVGSDWSTARVVLSESMFEECTSLVGGKGTTYDANHIDAEYAHIDGGESNPGYFTEKSASLHGDINGDGKVSIADVTELIDILMSGEPAPAWADVNGDGRVNINDVTSLINYLLRGTWD